MAEDLNNPPGYQGFENPMLQYYGTDPTLPVLFTGAYQTRQFGVGQADGLGRPITITSALANASDNMTDAEEDSITHAVALYAVTANDVFNYSPHT